MQLHHVTLMVDDLQAAGDFYVKTLGLELLPAGDIDYPGAFLGINDGQQLHLAELRDQSPSFRGHFCLHVRNFNELYHHFRERDLIDTDPWGKLRELPTGSIQFYVRDPAGNLVEINSYPEDRVRIDPAVFTDSRWGGKTYTSGLDAGRTYDPS